MRSVGITANGLQLGAGAVIEFQKFSYVPQQAEAAFFC